MEQDLIEEIAKIINSSTEIDTMDYYKARVKAKEILDYFDKSAGAGEVTLNSKEKSLEKENERLKNVGGIKMNKKEQIEELKQEIERLNYEYDKAFKRLKIQQQEIDRLRENEKLKTKFVKDREVKAVKEFAEKLKGIAFDNCKLGGHCQEVVDCDDIDGLLQECGVDVEK